MNGKQFCLKRSDHNMRSVYFTRAIPKTNFEISEKDDLHHLKNVIRVKESDEVLILSGNSEKLIFEVSEIGKKIIGLSFKRSEMVERQHRLSILLGCPKKEYFEECLRSCIPLNIETLYSFRSEYSQYFVEKLKERDLKIIKNSFQQSNNPHSFNYVPLNSLDEFDHSDFQHRFLSSVEPSTTKSSGFSTSEKVLVVVGPEGGLSQKEQDYFLGKDYLPLHLPCSILKTTLALPTLVGNMFGALNLDAPN